MFGHQCELWFRRHLYHVGVDCVPQRVMFLVRQGLVILSVGEELVISVVSGSSGGCQPAGSRRSFQQREQQCILSTIEEYCALLRTKCASSPVKFQPHPMVW